jgi:RND family efflux transporter MFP subunit
MKKLLVFFAAIFLPQAIWAADIQATLRWSQRVELSAPVSGIVQSVNVKIGDLVKKGQVLLTLDRTTFRARVSESRSEITRLNAAMEEARRNLDRVQELYQRTVASTADLDQAKLRMIESRSELDEARARLRQNQKALDDASIRAPFDAVVVLREAEPGQSVAAGLQPQMLLTLAKSGEMIARAYLPYSQVDNFKTGQALAVSVAGTNYEGKIKTIGMEPIKVNDDWVYPVDAVFPSKDTLRAGAPALLKLP